MKRFGYLMAAVLFGLLSLRAEAQNWSYIYQDREKKMTLHVDRESREIVSPGTFRIWVKYQYQQHFQGKRAYDCMKCAQEKLLSYTIAQKEFDCEKRQSRFLQVAEYYTDQTVRTERLVSAWRGAGEESFERHLINDVCAYGR